MPDAAGRIKGISTAGVEVPWPTWNSRVIVVREALQEMRPSMGYEEARAEAEAIVNYVDGLPPRPLARGGVVEGDSVPVIIDRGYVLNRHQAKKLQW